MFEIYKSIKGKKKTFLVFSGFEDPDTSFDVAKRFFKVSIDHIMVKGCWILNDELYFEDPHKKNAKKKVAIFWCK